MSFLLPVFALAIGLVLGLVGGGGSMLVLPLLVYGVHEEPRQAIAASAAVVSLTSAAGMLRHLRAENVNVYVGTRFGLAGMIGAWLGGHFSSYVPASWLLGAFGLMTLAAAASMFKAPPPESEAEACTPLRLVTTAMTIGGLTGLVGAGGGFVVVPTLIRRCGLPIREAVGTSMLVLTLQAGAAFAGHATHVEIDWAMIARLAIPAAVGAVVGGSLNRRVPTQWLRVGFGVLVLCVGLFQVGMSVWGK